MSKENRDQYQNYFLTSTEDATDAHVTNLEAFSLRLGYITAAVTGGKMSQEEAEVRVKDLYKVWKRSNKALDMGWEVL